MRDGSGAGTELGAEVEFLADSTQPGQGPDGGHPRRGRDLRSDDCDLSGLPVRHPARSLRAVCDDYGMKRRVAVYARHGRLFVSSWAATDGQYPAYVQGGWIEAADEPVPDADLGDLVRVGLANFKSGVPYPNFREGLTPEARRFLDVTK